MKLIGNVIIFTMSDLELTEADVKEKMQQSLIPLNSITATLSPEGEKELDLRYGINKLHTWIRPWCKNHLTCVNYKGKSKVMKL